MTPTETSKSNSETTKKQPRLHIFLGAGGVGKTTIAAGLAVHLAKSGKKCGLLSIDPARRLQSALGGTEIGEIGNLLWQATDQVKYQKSDLNDSSHSGAGELRCAMLNLELSLKRWIVDEGLSDVHEKKLFEHPLYRAVAQKVAAASETLAPVRMAEWLQQYPDTEELIIDTAPGIHAVDFLSRPERLLAFLDSRILNWLKMFAGHTPENSNLIQKIFRSGAKGILSALGKAGGENLLLSLGELLLMMDQVLYRMMDRLEVARDWIRHADTRIYLVSAVRDDAMAVTSELASLLEESKLGLHSIILNRCIPTALREDPALNHFLEDHDQKTTEKLYADFLKGSLIMEREIKQRLQTLGNLQEVPVLSNLESSEKLRLEDIELLGRRIHS